MTGPEHFAKAEDLVDASKGGDADDPAVQLCLAEAQVHATLALAAIAAEGIALAHGQDIRGYGR